VHVCPWVDCGKSFAFKHVWAQHLRTHTGDRPFACAWPGCARAFKSLTALTNHTDGHVRSAPGARLLIVGGARQGMRFVCGGCALPFPSKFNLERHAATCRARRGQEIEPTELPDSVESFEKETEGRGGWTQPLILPPSLL
jgi:hypothetical protein